MSTPNEAIHRYFIDRVDLDDAVTLGYDWLLDVAREEKSAAAIFVHSPRDILNLSDAIG